MSKLTAFKNVNSVLGEYIFFVFMVSYFTFFLLDKAVEGLVSNYFDLWWFVLISVIGGLLSLWRDEAGRENPTSTNC